MTSFNPSLVFDMGELLHRFCMCDGIGYACHKLEAGLVDLCSYKRIVKKQSSMANQLNTHVLFIEWPVA